MPQFVLIHSPLVGPSSLVPTADALSALGFATYVPTPNAPASHTRWCEWPLRLLDTLPELEDPILVGHSAGGFLAAFLAGTLNAKSFICLDAMMPPERGVTPPVEPAFLKFVRSLPITDGLLPIWTDWWEGDLLAEAPISPGLKTTFLAELPRLPLAWFDDSFEMPDWSCAKRGFIQTSPAFHDEAKRAEERGWPVIRLTGTHLHPALAPKETAAALVDASRRFSMI
ncbi:MAG: alpha/beta hydrolase [Rhodobiaceae bacterium]|nr:alpha/beta hydrolase [Rhodobiaceae bacterium]